MSTAINQPNDPNSTPGFSLPVTDAVLTASRVLVAVAARSLATVDQKVTLVQYRALVVLAGDPQTVGELAAALNVHPSTATRTCDRLVAKGLIRRAHDTNNRREVRVSLTASGRHIVDEVATLRRTEIERIVQRMTPGECEAAISSLTVFADAAGEARQADWALGWP